MRIETIETLDDKVGADSQSVVLLQKFSHHQRQVRAMALTVCGALLCVPIGLIMAEPAARNHLAGLMTSDAGAVFQLSLVCLIALIALILGLIDLCRPTVSKRLIDLSPERVTVADTVRGRDRRWQEPLEAYRGIRHRIVTTSDGAVHTLSLEHPQPSRSLCIAYETHVSNQAMIDVAGRLHLPILPAGSASGSGVVGNQVTGAIVQGLTGWIGAADGGRRAAST